jgi:hypothetical protein
MNAATMVHDRLGGPMDGLGGFTHKFSFFLFLSNLPSRHPIASEKVPFSMTFCVKRLQKPPWLTQNALLD